MGLGQRIEARRKEIGITQAELARRVGVRQSTMNSLINGDSRTSRSLLAIARELRTTAAFLSGETDDPDDDGAGAHSLNAEEQELVRLLRSMKTEDRRAIVRLVRSLGGLGTSSTVHARQHTFRGEGG